VTYFGLLATLIVPPALALMILVPRDAWRWLVKRQGQVEWLPYLAIGVHIVIALVYTTPWDNYLVATKVWWYNPNLVTGITLGWVPIEEYTFFIVQTLLTGLWTLALRRFGFKARPRVASSKAIRQWASIGVLILWLASTLALVLGWRPGTYLTLILSWALIPVLIQLAFGADILLAEWRRLIPIIAVPTLYLWLVDALAIESGTWTIDPAQTTGIKLGPLPMEEMLFFLMTNVIISFGITLMLSGERKQRAQAILAHLARMLPNRPETCITAHLPGHTEKA
jgi:lycopene cyclase domain-containing protein